MRHFSNFQIFCLYWMLVIAIDVMRWVGILEYIRGRIPPGFV